MNDSGASQPFHHLDVEVGTKLSIKWCYEPSLHNTNTQLGKGRKYCPQGFDGQRQLSGTFSSAQLSSAQNPSLKAHFIRKLIQDTA